MNKRKSRGIDFGIGTISVYILLLVALGTYFTPVLKIEVPLFGVKKWSTHDFVKRIPMKFSSQKEKSSDFKVDQDFFETIKKIFPKKEGVGAAQPQTAPTALVAAVIIPVALALTYLLVLLGLIFVSIGKWSAVFFSSIFSVCTAVCALFASYYLGAAANQAFADAVAKAGENFLGVVTKNFIPKNTIQLDLGLYLLVGFTILSFFSV
ncbi:MAG: hypothetical protein HY582_03630, partial [Candidatus Omnitrophica bacterium]|nr:hypothetical protein [Candidatus Omnitrophota bacterium]